MLLTDKRGCGFSRENVYSLYMGRGKSTTSEILYGATPPRGQEPGTNPYLEISLHKGILNLEEEDQLVIFEQVSGWSGSWGWAIKAPRLPSYWQVRQAGDHMQSFIYEIQEVEEERSEELIACRLEPVEANGESKMVWRDPRQKLTMLSEAITQRIAAVEQANSQSGEWRVLPGIGLYYLNHQQEITGAISLQATYETAL